jgi:hypothetical protein
MWQLLLNVSVENVFSKFINEFFAEQFLDDTIGIYDNESGSNIGKNLLFFISLNEIIENFRLIEYIHFAHIGIQLSF